MIKARIKLATGEVVTQDFPDRSALVIFLISGGHELIKGIEK